MRNVLKICNGVKIIKGGITAPKGFLASAVSCGLKKSRRPDLALLYSTVPAVCAGVFTSNRVKSESIIVTQRRIKFGLAQAVVVNSGNANCCVGARGIEDAETITGVVARDLGIIKNKVLIASTGKIGKPLPIVKIKKKITTLVEELGPQKSNKFARAIMTTDTLNKEIALEFSLNGKKARLGGVAKGAGMISPHMATMLAFFSTDVQIKKESLKKAFRSAVEGTFNCVNVDGDMSTNDTAIILANGLAENRIIAREDNSYRIFCKALNYAAKHLAKLIVKDGEGATRFIEVIVQNARNDCDAKEIAKRVANSNLVKIMIAGGDPNWGRIAAACGSAGVAIDSNKLSIYLGIEDIPVLKNGKASHPDRGLLEDIFKGKEILIRIDLKSGRGFARMWTCDLTEEYVRINSQYET